MIYSISLKQKYVDEFLNGYKRLELRTRIPRALKEGDKVIVAQTDSAGLVPMSAEVGDIIELTPDEMWQRYAPYLGIEYSDYARYTKGRSLVFGIELTNIRVPSEIIHINKFGIKGCPQWFAIVKTSPNITWHALPTYYIK